MDEWKIENDCLNELKNWRLEVMMNIWVDGSMNR